MQNSLRPETGTISLQQSLTKQTSEGVLDSSTKTRGFTFRTQQAPELNAFTMQKLSDEEVSEMNAVTLRNIYRNAGKAIY